MDKKDLGSQLDGLFSELEETTEAEAAGPVSMPLTGELAVGREMSMTLSLDHRVIDGATGGQFTASLRQIVENPATVLV